MNCLDCSTGGESSMAVAVCHDCGAAVCADHAVARDHHPRTRGAQPIGAPSAAGRGGELRDTESAWSVNPWDQVATGMSSDRRARTRRSISSRIGRTASTP